MLRHTWHTRHTWRIYTAGGPCVVCAMASSPDPDDDAAFEPVEVDLDHDTVEHVDAYRLGHGLETHAEAIIQLIAEALADEAARTRPA